MRILFKTWGGRAEHGVLEVDLAVKDGALALRYKAADYNDSCGFSEQVSCDVFETTHAGADLTRDALYGYIREDLTAQGHMDYWLSLLKPEDVTCPLSWPGVGPVPGAGSVPSVGSVPGTGEGRP